MKHVHFLGICGTAMGAVASAMARQGYVVTGTDANVYPPMSTFLENEGIQIFQGYNPANIPADTDMVVIGNAMSRGNIEVEAVLDSRLRYMSLPETMKEFFLWGKRNLVVTGTHGKTTTTSMLAWMLEANGLNPSFMIGGIARNLGRGGRFTDSAFCVLEGDEYDTSFFDKRSKFLHYLPEVVIINNIEMDHADIYANVEEIKLSFKRLLRVVPRNGIVFINADCPNCQDVRTCAAAELKTVRTVSVGMDETADIRITDIEHRPEGCEFTLLCPPAEDGQPPLSPLCGERFFVPMLGVEIMAGLGGVVDVHGDVVAGAQHHVQIGDALDLAGQVPGAGHGQIGVIAIDLHVQLLGDVGHLGTDGAKADDAQLLPGDLRADEGLFALFHQGGDGVPLTGQGSNPVNGSDHIPGGHHQRADQQFLHALGVGAGGVEHGNARLGAAVDGDIVHADARPADAQQLLVELHVVERGGTDQHSLRSGNLRADLQPRLGEYIQTLLGNGVHGFDFIHGVPPQISS